jgi:hypothetical protein
MSLSESGPRKIEVPLNKEGIRLEDGNQNFMLGDYQRALSDYTKSIKLKPEITLHSIRENLRTSDEPKNSCGRGFDEVERFWIPSSA